MNSNDLDAEIGRPHAKQIREHEKQNTDRVFVVSLRPLPGRDAIHELRGLLKIALRRHGFRCLSVTTEGVERSESAA